MKVKYFYLSMFMLLFLNCKEKVVENETYLDVNTIATKITPTIPDRNKILVETAQKYGPEISPTYEKAVCTELVIQVLEKIQPLEEIDKNRIRIITNKDIQLLLLEDSPIPKGVYFSLIEKGVGKSIDKKKDVVEGDLVQFWTETWGHCGIVRSIDVEKNEMELYSSYPSTNGYGIQKFSIPKHTFFVRLK